MAIRHDRKVSILDVMGPVMVGPSSSHTAGTARLGASFGTGAPEVGGEAAMDVDAAAGPDLRRAVLVGSALRRASDRPHVFAAAKAYALPAITRTARTSNRTLKFRSMAFLLFATPGPTAAAG